VNELVVEWRRGILPRFTCPECREDRLILYQVWNLDPDGVALGYTWSCRALGCKFIVVDT
jgi:hypothetical protein